MTALTSHRGPNIMTYIENIWTTITLTTSTPAGWGIIWCFRNLVILYQVRIKLRSTVKELFYPLSGLTTQGAVVDRGQRREINSRQTRPRLLGHGGAAIFRSCLKRGLRQDRGRRIELEPSELELEGLEPLPLVVQLWFEVFDQPVEPSFAIGRHCFMKSRL